MSYEDPKRSQQPREQASQPAQAASKPAIAPGKRTRTQSLPPGPAGTGAPVQRKPDPMADPARQEQRKLTARWIDTAVRPDLYPPPVQRKGMGVGTGAGDALSQPVGGSGRPMPENVQAKMERAFGADFSAVRIHEGPQASAMGALAYTQGSDIHFAPGQYAPQSQSGQELLGHELTHVVQQSQGRVQATTQAKGAELNDDPALEREADEMGAQAARAERVTPGAPPASKRQQRAHTANDKQGAAWQVPMWKTAPAATSAPPSSSVHPPNANVVQRVPSPVDAHTYKPGLSPIGPIYKNTYTGEASTTIQSGWCAGSFERRWQIYDADDVLLDESFYTWPQPTYTIPLTRF